MNKYVGKERELGVLTSLLWQESWAAAKREESRNGTIMERKRRISIVLEDVSKVSEVEKWLNK